MLNTLLKTKKMFTVVQFHPCKRIEGAHGNGEAKKERAIERAKLAKKEQTKKAKLEKKEQMEQAKKSRPKQLVIRK